MVDALSGIADVNENSFIESNELAQYMGEIVTAIANYEFDRRQKPYLKQCGDYLKFTKILRE